MVTPEPCQTVGEFPRGQQLGDLGCAVAPEPDIAPVFPVQVIQVQAAEPVAFGIHLDDAGGRALLQSLEQEVGQQKRGQVIHAEDRLEPLPGGGPGGRMQPGRIDQHIDAGVVSQQNIGRFADIPEIAEIRDDDIDRHVVLRHELFPDILGFVRVPADHDDMGAAAGKTLDGFQPHARGRS